MAAGRKRRQQSVITPTAPMPPDEGVLPGPLLLTCLLRQRREAEESFACAIVLDLEAGGLLLNFAILPDHPVLGYENMFVRA